MGSCDEYTDSTVLRSLNSFVPGNGFSEECFFMLVREKHLFQNIFHGGSRDALVHLLPMEPSAKEFQDSDRGEPPNGVRMFVPGNEFLCFFEFGNSSGFITFPTAGNAQG